jgi:hypothetical protein
MLSVANSTSVAGPSSAATQVSKVTPAAGLDAKFGSYLSYLLSKHPGVLAIAILKFNIGGGR